MIKKTLIRHVRTRSYALYKSWQYNTDDILRFSDKQGMIKSEIGRKGAHRDYHWSTTLQSTKKFHIIRRNDTKDTPMLIFRLNHILRTLYTPADQGLVFSSGLANISV